MATSFRLELDSEQITALLTGPEVQAWCSTIAQDIAERASSDLPDGEGFASHVKIRTAYRTPRAVATVYPTHPHAANKENKEHVLIKALGATQ